MKILFLGGNGNISWHCVNIALKNGHEVWTLNRAETRTTRREVQSEVHQIVADIRNADQTRQKLSNLEFDVVCDFICFNQEHAKSAIDLFRNITKQYIYISSEAVYKRKPCCLPFKENSEKYDVNESCNYIKGKISAEFEFIDAYEKFGFPVTIVRPGYTYDTIMPLSLGHNCFTAMEKIIKGFPMLMFGDGNNLWCPLYSGDFASAFSCLYGNSNAIGEDYHITGEKLITLNEMACIALNELNIPDREIIHISFSEALQISDEKSRELTKQHMMHNVFDNSKIKQIIPQWEQKYDFKIGFHETINWLMENDTRRRIDLNFEGYLNELYKKFGGINI